MAEKPQGDSIGHGCKKIVYKKLEEIVPYEKNPRKNDQAVEYVANSIKNFNFQNPIIIDKEGIIVAGHTRYKAAKKLKLSEVPCIVADDLTEEQIKAYRLADNKTGEAAEWDFELLDIELEDILDIDMEAFGFITEDLPEEFELESEKEKKGNVIVSLNIPTVPDWNMVEDEIKRIASEIDASVAVKLE